MLWRPTYENRELTSAVCPAVIGTRLSGEILTCSFEGVLIGGFDLRAFAEIGIWRRLVTEANSEVVWLVLYQLPEPGIQAVAQLRAMTPKSQWGSVALNEVTNDWIELIQPDRPERSFAGIVQAGKFKTLMVGIPTEDSWERFRQDL